MLLWYEFNVWPRPWEGMWQTSSDHVVVTQYPDNATDSSFHMVCEHFVDEK